MFQQAWQAAKAHLMAGQRLVLEIRPDTRSLAQNARLHAMLADVAGQLEWAGKKRDVDTWKRLMVAACGELMEFISAWGAEHGVRFREPGPWTAVDPETGEVLG